jgi:hypothetical protein
MKYILVIKLFYLIKNIMDEKKLKIYNEDEKKRI